NAYKNQSPSRNDRYFPGHTSLVAWNVASTSRRPFPPVDLQLFLRRFAKPSGGHRSSSLSPKCQVRQEIEKSVRASLHLDFRESDGLTERLTNGSVRQSRHSPLT